MNIEYPDGATPIDPDEAAGLKLPHITTRGELDRWEQENIIHAIAWLDKTNPKDILNESFVRALHHRMFDEVWIWAGRFRKSDKNIGGPWFQVPISVRALCDDAELWVELKSEPPTDIAVRFHHRLVSIHPFPNGNGRHARLMTDLLLENRLGEARFTWGSEDLSKAGTVRHRYIVALQAADSHDYGPLRHFVRT